MKICTKFLIRPFKDPNYNRVPSAKAPDCRCGGKAKVDYTEEVDDAGVVKYCAAVFCSKCNIGIAKYSTQSHDKAEKSAIKVWTRVMDQSRYEG